MLLSFFIARRYLASRKSERFISIIGVLAFIGIFLGVATLIIVTSVMNGFRADLYDRILGMNGHISVFSHRGKEIRNYSNIQDILQENADIVNATPVVQAEVLFSTGGTSDGGYVKGMIASDFQQRDFLNNSFDGDVAEVFSKGEILIGSQMARLYGLVPGDTLTIYSPFGITTAFGTLPRIQKAVVGGVFSFDMFEYDRNFIFMDLLQAQKLFNKSASVSKLEIHTSDPDQAIALTPAINDALPTGVYGLNWLETNGSLYRAIEIERRVSYIVLTLVILIAALNIVSAQIMLVKEKAKSIAILRSMGSGQGDILSVFALTGMFFGVFGTFLGAGSGILVVENIDFLRQNIERILSLSLFNQEIYHLDELPALLSYKQVGVTVMLSLGATFLAALYPAWRAAKLNPVEVLRYE